MTDPIRNDAKLQEVFDYAKSHPENWDQSAWRDDTACGTTFCLAGFFTWVFDKKEPVTTGEWYESLGTVSGPEYMDTISPFVRLENGSLIHCMDYAQKRLGLNSDEAEALFHSSNWDAELVLKEVLHDEYR